MSIPQEIKQFEGKWEELVQDSSQFAGRRVRVTVLNDERSDTLSLQSEILQWLEEGKVIAIEPAKDQTPRTFSDGLIEKFRKQGLVL